MANSFFQFKQFTVHQDRCAMKVTTDGCLFGAWTADHIRKTTASTQTKKQMGLDAGTGTGLLSLMVAQQNAITIDAVEIDAPAAEQAKENFLQSSYNERLAVVHSSLQSFTEKADRKYDVIFSNPPFFENDLKSVNRERNLALHSDELSLEDLFRCVNQLLTDEGRFYIIVPYHRKEETLIKAAAEGLFVQDELNVRQTTQHDFFRTFFVLNRFSNSARMAHEMSIKDNNAYTTAFTALLQDYYLYL